MRCPTCEKEFDPTQSAALPFCSERCRTIDLGRWLDEAYGIPPAQQFDDDAVDFTKPDVDEDYEV